MRLKLRSGTIDSIVFEAIFKYDEYKLPEKFSKDDVILDIGAHIGLFTYAVVQRGSQHIYAFEADAENYTIALENLKHYIDQGYVSFKRSAVWRSDISENALYHSGYFTDNNIINTGGGDVLWQKQGISVPALSFDTVVRDVTFQAQRRIRLLKLDCEGSEWPILFTSKTLHLVDEIYGEFHEMGGEYDDYHAPFSIEGFHSFTIHHLIKFLGKMGFAVTYSRRIEADGAPSRFGMFFATRLSAEPKPQHASLQLAETDNLLTQRNTSIPWFQKAANTDDDKRSLLDMVADQVGEIRSVAFSPDGNHALTGLADGTARLWNATRGTCLAVFKGHTNWVVSVAFSPDGSQVLTGSADGTARLWNAARGTCLAVFKGHTNWVVSVAFSPDGSQALTGSYDRTARLWNVTQRKCLIALIGHSDLVVSVAFSSDGSQAFTGSYDGTARMWDITQGICLASSELDVQFAHNVNFDLLEWRPNVGIDV
jgi:FkbM family methyltransferase